MTRNTDDGENHSSKIAVCIANKYLSRIPIVPPKSQGNAYERKQEVDREKMGVGGRVWYRTARHSVQRKNVVDQEQDRNDERLRNFDAVDTSQYVDAVRTENGNCCHVRIIQPSEVDQVSKIRLKLHRNDHVCDPVIHEVDDEYGDDGESRNEEFVAPSNVK